MKKISKYTILSALIMSGCSDDVMHIGNPDIEVGSGEVRINAEIDQVNVTRADDSGFADGDIIGIYAVDFENGQPGVLKSTGNNSDNVDFEFDEDSYHWSGSKSIQFKDSNTPLDLYGYYPYSKGISDVNRYPIAVEYNQTSKSTGSKMSNYEASDFLWAKCSGITSSSPNANLYFKHILSCVRVALYEGTGFSDGEWDGLDKFVAINNTSREAFVDLSCGEVTCTGEKDNRSIQAKQDKADFRAIVVPQIISAGEELLTITVDNHNYKLIKNVDMDFLQGKQHNFHIVVNKNDENGDFVFSLMDESITAWESDSDSHNGEAKEYLVVNLLKEGTLKNSISELNLDPQAIINLKISGPMNDADFLYIRNNITNLENINLMEVDLSNSSDWYNDSYVLPNYAFLRMASLRGCVFPKNLKVIGRGAFYGTSLSGTLNIPEGVEIIRDNAFCSYYNESVSSSEYGQISNHNNLSGNLVLPSSLIEIGGEAFRGCDFTGPLLLPSGLKKLGAAAFANCQFFTGDIHVPESVESIGSEAFSGMRGITGWITLPSNLKEIGSETFAYLNITGIEWPENLQSIGYRAFWQSTFKNDFKFPESVTNIAGDCFYQSKVKHITLPPNITRIPSMFMCGNSRESNWLRDTISIPNKVEVIEQQAFDACIELDAVILPESLQRIEAGAFQDCYNLSYIRCDAVEPPSIDLSTFTGVAKDNFTVEVPEESVDAYRNAYGWSEFKRISAYRNFVARPSKYNVLNNGGTKEIILNADADWELTDCPSWCHIDKKSGSKKSTLTLTVDKLDHGQPNRTGVVSFKLKDSDEHTTHINVGQYDYEYDEDQQLVLQKATTGNGIDLVFLGDGYDAADISSGLYLDDMKQEMEYFFGVEPYSSYREYFNVYTAFALSEDSGVENINSWRNTKFEVCTGDGCFNGGQRLSANYEYALDYCAYAVPATVNKPDPKVGCLLVGNTDIYEGVTYQMGGDTFCAVVTKSSDSYPYDARGLVQHEAGGHGIGWLADEYIYHAAHIKSCNCTCCKHDSELEASQSSGYDLNITTNGKYKEVPWSHLIFNPNYGDIVDVYEGGYFHSRGVYRSEINSCMNNNIPYLSTWSRQLIVERIMKLAGEQFDLDSFYAKDSRDMGSAFTSTSRSGASGVDNVPTRHGNPPIHISNYKYGKKGGKR